jgi:hypothetical protein
LVVPAWNKVYHLLPEQDDSCQAMPIIVYLIRHFLVGLHRQVWRTYSDSESGIERRIHGQKLLPKLARVCLWKLNSSASLRNPWCIPSGTSLTFAHHSF